MHPGCVDSDLSTTRMKPFSWKPYWKDRNVLGDTGEVLDQALPEVRLLLDFTINLFASFKPLICIINLFVSFKLNQAFYYLEPTS